MGGLLEKVTVASGTAYRHYIAAGSARVVYTRWASGSETTRYVTADHLNSSTVLMDHTGAALATLSIGAYGARRGSNSTGIRRNAGPAWSEITGRHARNTHASATRRGYTGHEREF